jgi:CBS domain-containing protein
MKYIKDILREKGSDVFTIKATEPVSLALKKLAEKDVGSLIVTDDDGTITGIISERDYARKIILKGLSSLDTPVNAIMEESFYYTHPETSVEECMALVTETHHWHLPVLENGELKGLVSIGDLVKAMIAGKEQMIEKLTNYIKSD